jgi:hypothetical protein
MFRQLPNYLFKSGVAGVEPALTNPIELFNRHPIEIAAYMEAFWNKRRQEPAPPPPATLRLGDPLDRSAEEGPPLARLPLRPGEILHGFVGFAEATGPGGFLYWDHLIYAYMIENTRVYEIFRRVLHEYRHGEKLGTPLDGETQNWLRITEELFYSDPAPFTITDVSSHIRSDLRASRRNAYQRMFGMDLNHGGDDGRPYPYVKAEAANTEFVSTFEEFLREVWVGITYVGATSSSDPTDDSKISELAEKLHGARVQTSGRESVTRGVCLRVDDGVVPFLARRPRIADRQIAACGGGRCGEHPVQDRRTRRPARARTRQELLRHRGSDVALADPDRNGDLRPGDRGARSVRLRCVSGRSRAGHAHDHHPLDGHYRPRRQGAEGGDAGLTALRHVI